MDAQKSATPSACSGARFSWYRAQSRSFLLFSPSSHFSSSFFPLHFPLFLVLSSLPFLNIPPPPSFLCKVADMFPRHTSLCRKRSSTIILVFSPPSIYKLYHLLKRITCTSMIHMIAHVLEPLPRLCLTSATVGEREMQSCFIKQDKKGMIITTNK